MNNQNSKCCGSPTSIIINPAGGFIECDKCGKRIPHPTTSKGEENIAGEYFPTLDSQVRATIIQFAHTKSINDTKISDFLIDEGAKEVLIRTYKNAEFADVPPTRLENWEEEFDNFYALPENMTPGPQRERAIKSFISTLLQEEREKQKEENIKLLQKELSRLTDVPDNDYNQGLRRGFDRSILTLDQS